MNIAKDEEQAGFNVQRTILGSVLFIGILWLCARMSPWCFINTGSFGWNTWTYAFPNLVCALDLREEGNKAFQDELNRRLRYFANLRELDLANNNLTEVPSGVIGMNTLESLSLSNNHLTSIPAEIDSLARLQSLDISKNDLRELPDSLGNMSLVSLNASDNEIAELPPGLAYAPSLHDIDISLNPISREEEEHMAETVTQNITGSTGGGISSTATSQQQGQGSSNASQTSSASSASASSGGSAGVTSSPASSGFSSAASSEETSFFCDRNLTVNHYHICIPPEWTVANLGTYNANLLDNGTLVARVQCPLEQNNYTEWDFSIRSRTFLKEDLKYGADLWTGTPIDPANRPYMILFLHKNDFNSWFGDNYTDVLQSCQIESMYPETQQNIFRTMYLSIQ